MPQSDGAGAAALGRGGPLAAPLCIDVEPRSAAKAAVAIFEELAVDQAWAARSLARSGAHAELARCPMPGFQRMVAHIAAVVFCPLFQPDYDEALPHAAALIGFHLLSTLAWPLLADMGMRTIHAFMDGSYTSGAATWASGALAGTASAHALGWSSVIIFFADHADGALAIAGRSAAGVHHDLELAAAFGVLSNNNYNNNNYHLLYINNVAEALALLWTLGSAPRSGVPFALQVHNDSMLALSFAADGPLFTSDTFIHGVLAYFVQAARCACGLALALVHIHVLDAIARSAYLDLSDDHLIFAFTVVTSHLVEVLRPVCAKSAPLRGHQKLQLVLVTFNVMTLNYNNTKQVLDFSMIARFTPPGHALR